MIKLSNKQFFFFEKKKSKKRLNCVFKTKDDTFLRLHEQMYLMSKNSNMCDRKE